MLSHLTLRNFATVESLEVEPGAGLTVITGETGAGKSIIIDALGLALGDRADSDLVRAGCDRAEVQASFHLGDCPAARAWLEHQDLDDGDDCLLRRTLRGDGRSRAWINGSPMPLQAVRELGELLIGVHSQHEHQALLRRDTQRDLLDSFAGATELARQVREHWRNWQDARKRHEQALAEAREQNERQELLRFQLEELDALALEEGELATLEGEQKRLANAEGLIRLCSQSVGLLYEQEEGSVNGLLGQIANWMEEAARQDDKLAEVLNTIESARLQAEAAADDLRHYTDGLELDPERLAQVEERLDQVYTLARKHRVLPEQLVEHHSRLREDAHQLEHFDEHLAELESASTEAEGTYRKAAETLGKQRREHAARLARGVIGHLKSLGMKGARLEVTLTPVAPCAEGLEQVELQFTANPGQPLKPLAKVASGGELSRISLAIQVICAQTLTVPCLVFDEVDVGVGGGIAEIVGRLLRELGEHAQVLCITHQPQVAALGHRHWQVQKQQSRKTTHTRIQALADDDRIEEVARMLGGVEITDSTLNHAKEMLQRGQRVA